MTRLLLLAAFAAGPFVALPASAQELPGAPTPADPIPVDGGIALLAAAGASYALYRLRPNGDDEEGTT